MGFGASGADEHGLNKSFSIWLRCRHQADGSLFPAATKPLMLAVLANRQLNNLKNNR